MRIGCDLDGVLADMDSAVARVMERLFGPSPASPAPAPVAEGPQPAGSPVELGLAGNGVGGTAEESAAIADEVPTGETRELTPRQRRLLWKTIRETENFWEGLDELEPGVVARLGALAQERRWEVIFITQRPQSQGDTCQLQTQRWLASHGFPYPSVFVIRGTRGRVASALDLDAVLDDRPENCLDVVADSKARSFLIWRGDPQAAVAANARRLGIDVIGTVAECLDQLVEADAPERPTLLGRIKKLINPT